VKLRSTGEASQTPEIAVYRLSPIDQVRGVVNVRRIPRAREETMRITMCTMRIAATVVVTAVSVGPAHAQGPGQMGGTITIWADANFRGQSATLRGPTPDLRQYGLNNNISSMRIAQGQSWEACEQPNFGGRCQVFTGNVRDLGSTSWNDKISSLRPVRTNVSGGNVVGPRPPGGPGYVAPAVIQMRLFPRPNFAGQVYAITGPMAQTGGVVAVSALVQGRWLVCDGRQFTGKCQMISDNVSDVRRIGIARIQSARPQ
jgi:hypothetical protein